MFKVHNTVIYYMYTYTQSEIITTVSLINIYHLV